MMRLLILTLAALALTSTGAQAKTRDCGDLNLRNGGPYELRAAGATCTTAKQLAKHVHARCTTTCTFKRYRCTLKAARGNTQATCKHATATVVFIESGRLLPAGQPIGCHPKTAKPLASTTDAVAFTLARYAPDGPKHTYAAIFACDLEVNRAVQLESGDFPDEDAHTLITLAGPFVGYADVIAFGAGASAPTVIVTDLRTGKDLHRWSLPAGNGFHIRALSVVSTGQAAWINETSDGMTLEVRRADGATGSALLDSGPQIDPASLKSVPPNVTWTNAGQPKTAPF